MVLRVRYWAAARELAGRNEETLEVTAPLDEAALKGVLGARHPALLAHLPRMRLAVNGEFADPGLSFGDGDEVDILPPVAGGSPTTPDGAPEETPEPAGRVMLADVRDAPLSVDEALRAVRHPSAGGIAIFTGVVRDHADGKPVARLDYEAHHALALKETQRILEGICATRGEVRVAAVHRIGQLAVGDLAVVIAASAPHRAEAFTACREAIDRIKDTVPIWKKEWGPEGDATWVNLEE